MTEGKSIIYKPSIYNTPTVYKNGAGGGGGDDTVNIGGREYKTTTINGVTWLAENLDYYFNGLVIGRENEMPATPSAWYYDNNSTTWGWGGRKCGLYYNWAAVKKMNDERNTHFPGWHVATKSDWENLTSFAGADPSYKLKSEPLGWCPTWDGTDDFKLSIIPNGRVGNDGGSPPAPVFSYATSEAWLFTSTEYDTNNAYRVTMSRGFYGVFNTYINKTGVALPVRLVKD